jgi:beta-mannosidase
LQAEGIRVGTEHFRRIRPRNMGALYWQVNDCWPVASWSGMDYFGRWKALHFYARRFFNDLLVSPHEEDGRVQIQVVSDRTRQAPAELRVTLMDFQGRVLFEKRENVNVEPLSSAVHMSLTKAELLKGRDPQAVFLNCELLEKGRATSVNRLFFAPFKDLRMPSPDIETEVTRAGRVFRVRLRASALARGVHLSAGTIDGAFSDNFFDLLPGAEVNVEFRPRRAVPLAELRRSLKVRSLADALARG